VREDVTLIRSELDHCRAILDRMTGQAGQVAGEEVSPITLDELIEESLAGLRQAKRVQVRVRREDRQRKIVVPLQGLALALRNVLQNAIDASEPASPVELRLIEDAGFLRIEVRDRGIGMSAETIARAVEPFFTTKDPGRGMGLGLFLTRGVIDRLGGEFRIDSALGRGTTVMIRLPWVKGD
jgi:two-component system sensor histidine kinase RegB